MGQCSIDWATSARAICDCFRHLLNYRRRKLTPLLYLNLTDSEDFKGIMSFMLWSSWCGLSQHHQFVNQIMPKIGSSWDFCLLLACMTFGKTLSLLKSIHCWWVFRESSWCVVETILWHYLLKYLQYQIFGLTKMVFRHFSY